MRKERRLRPGARLGKLYLLALALVPVLRAHQQPTTLVMLDVGSRDVTMRLHIPLVELELAFGHHVTERPEEMIKSWGPPFREYLLQHVHPTTAAGQLWLVQVQDLSVAAAEQTQSGPFQEVVVHLLLTPPPGGDLRNFILNYNVILHQVVTHRALVSIHRDWAAGQVEPTQIGVLAVDTGTAQIAPLVVHLGEGSAWAGFASMVRLGAHHIREGTDHLLFLLVLLLPATLKVKRREWGGFGGASYSLARLIKIVTAFTLGHSVTLLAGALHWLTLPPQPVEIFIAGSILVTAIHAVHPIFPGYEAPVAAGFGLVHGLAFATVLADLQLAAGPMALSIFGFNLGIELMQLFVVACTMPWLILLSLTPAHAAVRIGGAVLAAFAAAGWIANRVTGQSNVIERAMTTVTQFSPWGIVILALITIPAYLYNSFPEGTPHEQ